MQVKHMDKVRRNFTMTLLLAAFLNGHVAAQEHNIMLELNQGLAQLKQSADNDPEVKAALDALARQVPEVGQTLRLLANDSQAQISDQARYGLYRQFFFDAKSLSPQQLDQAVQSLRGNALIKSAEPRVLSEMREVDPGPPVTFKRNAVLQRPAYLLGPAPLSGNQLGGINSDAVREIPGGRGDYARVIIASESFWDQNHSSLPTRPFHPIRPAQRLSCGLYWAVGNSGTQAAGIIADKNFGVVPAAQLTATPSSWRGGIYFNDIHAAGLKRGDVVVIDALTSENMLYHYPRHLCPGGTVCTLPLALSAADGNTLASYLRDIEYLTEKEGVHVIINAGGGTQMLAESWQPQFPGRYMPINLDSPDLQGNFDRSRNDDGSIVVGSVNPVTGTAVGANYGSRIDVSTWATNIQTAAYQPGVKDLYTRYDAQNPLAYKFSAWIVAGAVAQIQSIAFARGLGPVPPKVMRQLLIDTGHDFAHAVPGVHRGRQPDVKAAVDKMLSAYANGFPPEPAGPTIKRIEGPGYWAGDRGSSYGGARSNATETYRPVLNTMAQGVTFDWKVASPLIIRSVDPATGELKVDVPARVGAYWHQPPPPSTSVTLTTRDKNGTTDTYSRSSSIVGVYTTDQTYAATWNVPDTLDAGRAVSLTVTPKPSSTGAYRIRWIAPGLFPGVQEKTGASEPYTITVTPPPSATDTRAKIEVGGTTLTGPRESGFYLSKTVTVRASGHNRPVGTLEGADTQNSGDYVTYTANARDPDSNDPLTYNWTLPAGFTGANNTRSVNITLPNVTHDTQGTLGVAVTDSRGGVLNLSKIITVKNLPPHAILSGPASVAAGSAFTVYGAGSKGNGLTYRWSAPGFTPQASTLKPTVVIPTFTAPANMPAGANTIEMTATDMFGRTSSARHDITVTSTTPTVSILGPDSVKAGQTVTYTAQASNPTGGTLRYIWRVPAGFAGTAANSPQLVITAPATGSSTSTVVGLIAGVGTQQTSVSKTITVVPADVTPPDAAVCAPAWSAATTYATPGVTVSYAGYNYQVAYWTQNNPPDNNYVLSGSAKPWRRIGSCQP